jgi:hypothetical protein
MRSSNNTAPVALAGCNVTCGSRHSQDKPAQDKSLGQQQQAGRQAGTLAPFSQCTFNVWQALTSSRRLQQCKGRAPPGAQATGTSAAGHSLAPCFCCTLALSL